MEVVSERSEQRRSLPPTLTKWGYWPVGLTFPPLDS